MTHPHFHAESSVRRWGGVIADYMPIYDWLDATSCCDVMRRAQPNLKLERATMTHRSSANVPSSTTWHRKGTNWVLFDAGRPVARVERDGDRWLCFAIGEGGDDWFLGPSDGLASGKAALARRCTRRPLPFSDSSRPNQHEEAPL